MSVRRLALLAALAFSSVAGADSFTSSASSAASQSVGSLSDSVSKSSDASSGDAKKTAGAYRVTAVARLDGERLRLQLEPAAGQTDGFALTLPAAVAEQQALAPGATLWVAPRAYGLAFAAADGAAPFFLAVDERLRRELDSVKL